MAKLQLKAGTTSKSVLIFVQDSSATTGIGLSGLVFNTSNLIAYWCQPGVTAPAAITLATLATMTTAYSSGAFLEADATHMKGVYRFDIPNTCLTGATDVVIMLSGAANMVPVLLEIELTASDNQDGVHFGLTSLPNAVPGAAGGLFVAGANAPTSITGTSNSAGLTLAGAGTGAGLSVTGGATGHAFGLVGGATSGDGINITTTSGHGINAAPLGQAKHGLFLTGSSNSLGAACDGARLVGGFTGIGLHCLGGTNSGEGIRAEAITGNGDGISGISFGSGVGFRSNAAAAGFGSATTPPTAAAIATAVWHDLTAGSDFTTTGSIGKLLVTDHLTVSPVTLADGVAHGGSPGTSTATLCLKNITAQNSSGNAIDVTSTFSTGNGIVVTPGATGTAGLLINGGSTSGDGFRITTTSGNGVSIVPAGGLGINSPLSPPTGPATDFLTAITQLFYRFFPPGPSGQVIKSKLDNTLKTKDSGGTVVSTQTWADDGTGNESIGPAS